MFARRSSLLAIAAVLASSAPALADQCAYIDQATADRAVDAIARIRQRPFAAEIGRAHV